MARIIDVIEAPDQGPADMVVRIPQSGSGDFQIGSQVIVRGLRAMYDFELEYQTAMTNQQLAPEVDIVCLMTSLEHAFISSTVVKEIAREGGPLEQFVPPVVSRALVTRLGGARRLP